ncbi:MAG: sulfatase-like hydrolase/transferase [Propionibacteriaceae bacterium]|nr:sulfatase-like hydrolase/transferase [Propionibacteriaceae bacterium]
MKQSPEGGASRSFLSRSVPWVLTTFALIVAALAAWVRFEFGEVTFEQVVSNFPVFDLQSVGNPMIFNQVVLGCVLLPILAVGLIAMVVNGRSGRGAGRIHIGWLRVGVPLLAVAVSLGTLASVTAFPRYAAAVLADRTFAASYLPPAVTSIPARPLNLITIHLESVEATFADEAVFGENLLAGLDRATQGWADYPGLQQDPGGGWTMAGLVGTQCGIPLKSPSLALGLSPNQAGQGVRHYLPGATCLGDLLAANGYLNAFVGGADADFGGKSTYLSDHGYRIDQGLADWVAGGEDPANLSSWGLSDARLFVHARDTVRQLRATGKPYNLTLLTLDTHEPPATFVACPAGDGSAMARALRCSLQAVAGFLADLKADGSLDDTVVVLTSDHLKMAAAGASYRAELTGVPERALLLRVWSPRPVTFSRDRADQLSLLATTLELLGFGLPDGRAGLGVSFVGGHPLAGTALELPEAEYQELVTSPSTQLYRQFWQDP